MPEELGKAALITGKMRGPSDDIKAWDGLIYVRGDGLVTRGWANLLADKASHYLPAGLSGRLDTEIWLTRKQQHTSQINGYFGIDAFKMACKTDDYRLDQAEGHFIWWSDKQGWHLNVNQIKGIRGGAYAWDDIAISAAMETQQSRYTIAISELPIAETGRVAACLPRLEQTVPGQLEKLHADGHLYDIQIEMAASSGIDKDSATPMYIKTAFDNLSIRPWKNIPGVSGISGVLEGSLQQGKIYLESENVEMTAPRLLRTSQTFSLPGSYLSWHQYEDRFQISSEHMQAKIDASNLDARFQIDWFLDGASPWVDLQLAIDSVKLNKVPGFLPTGIMQPSLVKWFDVAFKKGVGSNLDLILQGDLSHFPFDDSSGVFQAEFDVQDGLLNYSHEWGKLEDFNGHIIFDKYAMDAQVEKGRILNSPVSNVKVSISDFRVPLLKVRGKVMGRLPAILGYITHSPLDESFGEAVRAIETQGSATVDLSLGVPLGDDMNTEFYIDGKLHLKNNTIRKRGSEYALQNLRGDIVFSESDFDASDVQATFMEQPATVDVLNAKKQQEAQIKIQGPLKLLEYIQTFNWPLVDHFSGDSLWSLTIHIPTENTAGDRDVWVDVKSDLKGIQSDLPVPFTKKAKQKIPLRVDWVPGDLTLPVHIKYGNKADTVLMFDSQGSLTAGEVKFFSKQAAAVPKRSEFRLNGHLPVGAPLQWISLFTEPSSDSNVADVATGKKIPPLVFDLSVNKLALTKFYVRSVKIKSKSSSPWIFMLSGVGTGGWLELKFDDQNIVQKIRSDLNYLSIRSSDLIASTTWGLESVAPSEIPSLSVRVGDMIWDGKELGELQLESSHRKQVFVVDHFQVKSEALHMQASGEWGMDGDRQTTRLSAEIRDGSLEKIMRQFGGSDAIIGGSLTGTFIGGWPGSPAEFSFQDVNGELTLSAKKGRIIDADPGAGKLLGLLSLRALPRRLFFDFTDLSKQGFSFDKIMGTFILNDGNAFTSDLKIVGPAAEINIAGRTGLVAQDYDELVTVIPGLTSSLPIAGAIVGGPAVGAAVLLAERLIGKQLNKMSKIEYQVTGSWDEPEYERLNIPDVDRTSDFYSSDDDYFE